MVLTFFMDSTSPQKVIFTIYLNIEYSLCNSVGETFLLHLVLVGEGEGWGDNGNAATREDVAGGEEDMEDVTGEGDMEKGEREREIHLEKVFTTDPFLVHSETDIKIKELTDR